MAIDEQHESETPQRRPFQFTLARMLWANSILCLSLSVMVVVLHTQSPVRASVLFLLAFQLFGASVGTLAGGFIGAVKGIGFATLIFPVVFWVVLGICG